MDLDAGAILQSVQATRRGRTGLYNRLARGRIEADQSIIYHNKKTPPQCVSTCFSASSPLKLVSDGTSVSSNASSALDSSTGSGAAVVVVPRAKKLGLFRSDSRGFTRPPCTRGREANGDTGLGLATITSCWSSDLAPAASVPSSDGAGADVDTVFRERPRMLKVGRARKGRTVVDGAESMALPSTASIVFSVVPRRLNRLRSESKIPYN